MVTICEQCGDKGFANALIYCDECTDNAVHRYCLHVTPATLDEYVIWYCVDCEPKHKKPSNVNHPSSALTEKCNTKNSDIVQEVGSGLRLEKKKKKRKRKSFFSTKSRNKHKKRATSDSLVEAEKFAHENSSPSNLKVPHLENCKKDKSKPSNVNSPSSLLAGECNTKNSDIVQEMESGLGLKKKNKKKRKRFYTAKSRNKRRRKRPASDSLAEAEKFAHENTSPSHHKVHRLENCQKDQSKLYQKCSDEADESARMKTSTIAVDDDNNNRENILQLHHSESKEYNEKFKRNGELVCGSSGVEAGLDKTRTHPITTAGPPITPECCSNHQRPPITESCCVENGEQIESMKVDASMVAATSHSSVHGNRTCLVAGLSNDLQQFNNNEKDERPEANRESVEASSQIIPTPLSIIPRKSYGRAQPRPEPVWNGILSVNEEIYGKVGVVAHLSTLACPRVFEEAKLLPWSLCLELLPRCDVWPKSYQKRGLGDESIALYLFPNNDSDEKVYDSLVEDMIKRDLAMKALVTNAELLLFTSNLLPSPYWRFQSKLYLWGVFRGKKTPDLLSKAIAAANHHANTTTWHASSPLSPLSNSGSFNSASVYSPDCPQVS